MADSDERNAVDNIAVTRHRPAAQLGYTQANKRQSITSYRKQIEILLPIFPCPPKTTEADIQDLYNAYLELNSLNVYQKENFV